MAKRRKRPSTKSELKRPTVKRDSRGLFLPGHTMGRPRLGLDAVSLLTNALEQVGRKKGRTIFVQAARKAYKSDAVLLGILRKFIPDKTETKITTTQIEEAVLRLVSVIVNNFPSPEMRRSAAETLRAMAAQPGGLLEVSHSNGQGATTAQPVTPDPVGV